MDANIAMRRSRVALATGGPSYPAYVRLDRPAARGGHVRPYLTRRTASQVLRDIQSRERQALGDDPASKGDSTDVRWEGRTLLIQGRAVGGKLVRTVPNNEGLYPLFGKVDWVDVWPNWPRRAPDPVGLLRLLEMPTLNRMPLLDRVGSSLPTETLVQTLELAGAQSKELLVHILADRNDDGARRAIAGCLSDGSPDVRAAAAHAVEHSGDQAAQEQLQQAIERETNHGVRELQRRALRAMPTMPR